MIGVGEAVGEAVCARATLARDVNTKTAMSKATVPRCFVLNGTLAFRLYSAKIVPSTSMIANNAGVNSGTGGSVVGVGLVVGLAVWVGFVVGVGAFVGLIVAVGIGSVLMAGLFVDVGVAVGVGVGCGGVAVDVGGTAVGEGVTVGGAAAKSVDTSSTKNVPVTPSDGPK